MLSDFMRIRHPRAILLLLSAAIVFAGSVACQRVPLLAPTGSTITLTASATALPSNGSTDIIAQVIQPSGSPPHSGTHVTFTTTLGSIQPSDATTDVSGRAVVRFVAGGQSGTATIQAISGGVSAGTTGAVKILVGTAGVGRVIVSANPTLVPALGGSSAITVSVIDVNGNPLSAAPVSFSTTAGTLADTVVVADQSGIARTTLQTATSATVTASVGAQGGSSTGGGTTPPAGGTPTPPSNTAGQASGTVTVGVLSSPGLVITPPTTPPGAGLPASFSFVVTAATTNGSFVRNVHVDWGDGSSQDLGGITGTAIVTHVYTRAGTFAVNATLTDSGGNSFNVGTTVTVIATPSPTVLITPSVPAQSTPVVTVTFQLQVTPPTGVGIQDAVIDYGDGNSQGLGGLTGSVTVSHDYRIKGPVTVSLTVTDTLQRNTVGRVTINVP
jgi:adhesin/invasin